MERSYICAVNGVPVTSSSLVSVNHGKQHLLSPVPIPQFTLRHQITRKATALWRDLCISTLILGTPMGSIPVEAAPFGSEQAVYLQAGALIPKSRMHLRQHRGHKKADQIRRQMALTPSSKCKCKLRVQTTIRTRQADSDYPKAEVRGSAQQQIQSTRTLWTQSK